MKVELEICGIVMPISALDDCTESHWADVLSILNESVELAGFKPNLVSNSDDVGVIQKRIIQNLYDNPIVVCDVSGRNANVMFELGMRLAFDKPTIIVKDEKTPFSFDTSPIEHISYPRDLRFSQIVEFKKRLSDKIRSTFEKSKSDSDYTPFLKHFGQFKVSSLEQKEVSSSEYIMEELRDLRRLLMRRDMRVERNHRFTSADKEFCALGWSQERINEFLDELGNSPFVKSTKIVPMGGHSHIEIDAKFPNSKEEELFERNLEFNQRRIQNRQRHLNSENSKKVEEDT